MKAKDKVLKLKASAVCEPIHLVSDKIHYQIMIDGVCYGIQARESWAWAEAYRILSNPIFN